MFAFAFLEILADEQKRKQRRICNMVGAEGLEPPTYAL